MTTPSKTTVEHETANVMHSAVMSAVQLGNFPLQVGDVQCAFECWVSEMQARPLHKMQRYATYVAELEGRVRLNLVLLGFAF